MNNLEAAAHIARTFMQTHGGELPLMVVGFNEQGESMALLGNFRKKHELDDQNTFCAILRLAFVANRIREYYVMAKSRMLLLEDDEAATEKVEQIGGIAEDEGVPALIVIKIAAGERAGKIFQMTEGGGYDFTEVMAIDAEESNIEGKFMQLLPERDAELPANVTAGIERYVKMIRYIAPVIEEPAPAVAKPNGIEALFSGWNAV